LFNLTIVVREGRWVYVETDAKNTISKSNGEKEVRGIHNMFFPASDETQGVSYALSRIILATIKHEAT
jgi:hypothetical protein